MFIPLLFPLIGSQVASSFSEGFLLIATKVFPLIVLPLILAFITRHAFKKLHHFIVVKLKDLGFYVWAITLLSVTGVAWGNIIDTTVDSLTLVFLIFIGFLTTGAQFGFGKFVGQLEGQRISAGQSLGQKNMVFGIWCTSSFLNPAAAIAAASEDPKSFGKSLIFVALGESIALYGVVISILILNKLV